MYLWDFEHSTKYFWSPKGIFLQNFLHLCISTDVDLPKKQGLLRSPEELGPSSIVMDEIIFHLRHNSDVAVLFTFELLQRDCTLMVNE